MNASSPTQAAFSISLIAVFAAFFFLLIGDGTHAFAIALATCLYIITRKE
jgi:uncharacterized membrane protein YgaE (UPF0421/DUF939 family)